MPWEEGRYHRGCVLLDAPSPRLGGQAILRDGETKQAWRDRVLDGAMVINVGVKMFL